MHSYLPLTIAAVASLAQAAVTPSVPNTITFAHADGSKGACLTASSTSNGGAVTVSSCTGADNQAWTFVQDASSKSTIAQTGAWKVFGTKCLDVTDGTDASGTKLQIWDCVTGSTNQHWVVNSNTSYTTIQWDNHSRCMDLTGGSESNGNQVQIWSCGATYSNQRWIETPVGGTTPPPSNPGFNLEHVYTGGALCLSAPTNTSGVQVTAEACNLGPANHNWTYVDGSLRLFGDKCLDVIGGANADGTKVQIYECFAGNTNQQWVLNSDTSIQWKGTNKCLDFTDGQTVRVEQMQVWTCSKGNTNQQWKKVAATSS